MALAFAVTPIPSGSKTQEGVRTHLVDITFDATYATPGYVLTAANLGFDSAIKGVIPGSVHAYGVTMDWDQTNKRLRLNWTGSAASAVLAEIGDSTAALSGKVGTILAFGN